MVEMPGLEFVLKIPNGTTAAEAKQSIYVKNLEMCVQVDKFVKPTQADNEWTRERVDPTKYNLDDE